LRQTEENFISLRSANFVKCCHYDHSWKTSHFQFTVSNYPSMWQEIQHDNHQTHTAKEQTLDFAVNIVTSCTMPRRNTELILCYCFRLSEFVYVSIERRKVGEFAFVHPSVRPPSNYDIHLRGKQGSGGGNFQHADLLVSGSPPLKKINK